MIRNEMNRNSQSLAWSSWLHPFVVSQRRRYHHQYNNRHYHHQQDYHHSIIYYCIAYVIVIILSSSISIIQTTNNCFVDAAASSESSSSSAATNNTITCRFVLNDIYYDPDLIGTTTSSRDEFYACQPVVIRESHEIIQSHMYLLDDDLVPDSLKEELSHKGHYSYLYVQISNVILDPSTARVLPINDNVNDVEFTIITLQENQVEKNVGTTNKFLRRENRLREMQQSDGQRQTIAKNVLILRIVAKDSEPTTSATELYDLTFSTASERSVRSQMLKCSAGQLYIQPAMSGVGIIDVPVDVYTDTLRNDKSSQGAGDDQFARHVLINAAYDAAPEQLRQLARSQQLAQQQTSGSGNDMVSSKSASGTTFFTSSIDPDSIDDVRSVADLVMLIIPPIKADRNWAAFGTVNGAASVYNDQWGSYLGATMHEIGHNLGLYHSNVNGIEYRDTTGYMGSAPKKLEFPTKCYNAQNHDSLKWFRDKTINLLSYDLIPQVINVAAFVDYSKLVPNDPYNVIITIDDVYYMQYNRAKSYNNETSEYPNTLIIIRNAYKGTDRVAELTADEHVKLEATVHNANDVFVTVCDVEVTPYYNGDDSTIDSLRVAITFDKETAIELCTSTLEPTLQPSLPPPPSLVPTMKPSHVKTDQPTTDAPFYSTDTPITTEPSFEPVSAPVPNKPKPVETYEPSLPDRTAGTVQPTAAPVRKPVFIWVPPPSASNGGGDDAASPAEAPATTTLAPSEIIHDGIGHHNATGGGFVALKQEQSNNTGLSPTTKIIVAVLATLIGLVLFCILRICYRSKKKDGARNNQKDMDQQQMAYSMSDVPPKRGFFRINTSPISEIDDIEKKGSDENGTVTSSASKSASTLSSSSPDGARGIIMSPPIDPIEVATSMLNNIICTPDNASTTPVDWKSYIMSAASEILDPQPNESTNNSKEQTSLPNQSRNIPTENEVVARNSENAHAQFVSDRIGSILEASMSPFPQPPYIVPPSNSSSVSERSTAGQPSLPSSSRDESEPTQRSDRRWYGLKSALSEESAVVYITPVVEKRSLPSDTIERLQQQQQQPPILAPISIQSRDDSQDVRNPPRTDSLRIITTSYDNEEDAESIILSDDDDGIINMLRLAKSGDIITTLHDEANNNNDNEYTGPTDTIIDTPPRRLTLSTFLASSNVNDQVMKSTSSDTSSFSLPSSYGDKDKIFMTLHRSQRNVDDAVVCDATDAFHVMKLDP